MKNGRGCLGFLCLFFERAGGQVCRELSGEESRGVSVVFGASKDKRPGAVKGFGEGSYRVDEAVCEAVGLASHSRWVCQVG